MVSCGPRIVHGQACVLEQDMARHVVLKQDMVSCSPRTGPIARQVVLGQDKSGMWS
jgi:hypothetical protein